MKSINNISKIIKLILIVLTLSFSVNAAIVSHSASEILIGSFAVGDYTFPSNLAVSGTITENGNNVLTTTDQLTASNLAADSVGASEIAADAVRASEIQAGAVGTSEVADNTLTADDLAANACGNSELIDDITVDSIAGNNLAIIYTAVEHNFQGAISTTVFSQIGSDPMCWDGSGASYMGDCSSLRKYKENIVPYKEGLNELIKLEPKLYDWINGSKNTVGFIAEEVEEVIPSLAKYREGNLTGYQEFGMSALIVNAVKELKAEKDSEIEILKQKNIDQDSKINLLELENDLLKEALCEEFSEKAICGGLQ